MRRGLLGLRLLALVVGLTLLRSTLNLCLLESSLALGAEREKLHAAERRFDRERIAVERLTALAAIEPRARAAGLVRPPSEAVMLLAATNPTTFPGARPLGVPGAGALGRWFERAAQAARVSSAVASEPGMHETPAAETAGHAAAPRALIPDRCEICQKLALGEEVSH
jgi:hypothetical protein